MKQEVIAIIAAILEAGERSRPSLRSSVLSAADFVKRAEVIYAEATPKDYHFKFDFADGGVIQSVDSAQHLVRKILNKTKVTKIIEHPQERYAALHVYAVDGQDVMTSRGEQFIRDPLNDKYEGGFLWRKWVLLPALEKKHAAFDSSPSIYDLFRQPDGSCKLEQRVYDLKHGGFCIGGIFCICEKGCGHKAKSEHKDGLGRFSSKVRYNAI